jgi:hypothetical protein
MLGSIMVVQLMTIMYHFHAIPVNTCLPEKDRNRQETCREGIGNLAGHLNNARFFDILQGKQGCSD